LGLIQCTSRSILSLPVKNLGVGVPHLEVRKKDRRGVRRIALDQSVNTVGRSDLNTIVLHDDRVSRHHCVIDLVDDLAWIRDAGSRSGITVNFEPVVRAALQEGDLIKIGPYEMIFHVANRDPRKPVELFVEPSTQDIESVQDDPLTYARRLAEMEAVIVRQQAELEQREMALREARLAAKDALLASPLSTNGTVKTGDGAEMHQDIDEGDPNQTASGIDAGMFQDEVETLRQQLDDARISAESLSIERDEIRAQCERLVTQLAEVRETLKREQGHHEAERAQSTSAPVDPLDDQDEINTSRERELAETRAALQESDELVNLYCKERDELRAQFDALEAQQDERNRQIASLQAHQVQLHLELDSARASLAEAEARYETISTELAMEQSARAQDRQLASAANARADALAEQLQAAQTATVEPAFQPTTSHLADAPGTQGDPTTNPLPDHDLAAEGEAMARFVTEGPGRRRYRADRDWGRWIIVGMMIVVVLGVIAITLGPKLLQG
jgi:peptidoglycan hydrolase CwlO-like protein